MALLAYGEGWHNNHHAFPWSARAGLGVWEVDPSYWSIRLFKKLGLVTNIWVPSRERMRALALPRVRGQVFTLPDEAAPVPQVSRDERGAPVKP